MRPFRRSDPCRHAGTRVAVLAAAWLVAVGAAGAQQDESLLSVIRDQDSGFRLRDARRLLEQGHARQAIEIVLQCLEAQPSAVVPADADRWLGAREAARDELARLSGEAVAVYERLVQDRADAALHEAAARGGAGELLEVAMRFPSSSIARAARRTAADRFLEGGRLMRALQELSLIDAGSLGARDHQRLAYCRTLLGLPLPASPLPDPIGFGESVLDRAQWDEQLARLPARSRWQLLWPAYGGMTRPGPEPVAPDRLVVDRSLGSLEGTDTDEDERQLFPVLDGASAFVNDGTRVHAIGLAKDGGAGWSSVRHVTDDPFEPSFALSPHMAHSAALGGARGERFVVAPLQIPTVSQDEDSWSWRRWGQPTRIPVRRLHAFDARTGRLVWRHFTGHETNPTPEDLLGAAVDVSGPPLIVDETVYVASHRRLGGIAMYLSAFDLRTGRLKWNTLVCTSQIESGRRGTAMQEFAASPLAWSDGLLFGATHLGLCFAIRADDGAIRWLHRYPIIPIPVSRRRWRGERLRELFWANNPPAVADGVVVLTPIDSEDALALDARSGRVVWRLPHDLYDRARGDLFEWRWLLGAATGYAWFAGNGICKVPLTGDDRGKVTVVARADTLGHSPERSSARSIPRGLLTNEHVYHVAPAGGLVIVDFAGTVVGRRRLRDHEIGNLATAGGPLVIVRPGRLRAFSAR